MAERENRMHFTLSDDERERLVKVADKHGMKPSIYARYLVLQAIKNDE